MFAISITHASKNYLTIDEIANSIERIKDTEILHTLFYHSLFDYTAEFVRPEYPITLVKQQREELQDLLCEVFQTEKFKTDAECYRWFEDNVISKDILCRVILHTQLSALGLPLDPITKKDKKGECDLRIKEENLFIELKRVTGWGNYVTYFNDFYNKTSQNCNYVYVVLTAHPPEIRDILTQLSPNDADELNTHIRQIIRAHFIVENLLGKQKAKNIQFVVAPIKIPSNSDNTDKDNIDNDNNKDDLTHVCEQIKQKIAEFENVKEEPWWLE